MGMRGRKAQSSLEDDEVARIRAALAAQEKPQVHVGEEKVVADRVVKGEEEGHAGEGEEGDRKAGSAETGAEAGSKASGGLAATQVIVRVPEAPAASGPPGVI